MRADRGDPRSAGGAATAVRHLDVSPATGGGRARCSPHRRRRPVASAAVPPHRAPHRGRVPPHHRVALPRVHHLVRPPHGRLVAGGRPRPGRRMVTVPDRRRPGSAHHRVPARHHGGRVAGRLRRRLGGVSPVDTVRGHRAHRRPRALRGGARCRRALHRGCRRVPCGRPGVLPAAPGLPPGACRAMGRIGHGPRYPGTPGERVRAGRRRSRDRTAGRSPTPGGRRPRPDRARRAGWRRRPARHPQPSGRHPGPTARPAPCRGVHGGRGGACLLAPHVTRPLRRRHLVLRRHVRGGTGRAAQRGRPRPTVTAGRAELPHRGPLDDLASRGLRGRLGRQRQPRCPLGAGVLHAHRRPATSDIGRHQLPGGLVGPPVEPRAAPRGTGATDRPPRPLHRTSRRFQPRRPRPGRRRHGLGGDRLRPCPGPPELLPQRLQLPHRRARRARRGRDRRLPGAASRVL